MDSRNAGVLLHISSLPNKYNIGSLGSEAYEFVDFLSDSGMSYWQFLPLNAIYLDPSPYASISSCAYNFYLISIEKLMEIGLLKNEDVAIFSKDNKINYEKLYPYKRMILKNAYDNFVRKNNKKLHEEFEEFCHSNKNWLDDFALFISLKEMYIYKRKRDKQELDLTDYIKFVKKYKYKVMGYDLDKYYYEGYMFTWDEDIKYRKPLALNRYKNLLSREIDFYKFTQFIFFKQFNELHSYAKSKGIKFIGDIPMYLADDCVDCWVRPDLFYLDEDLIPTKVAGVPPDYFSKTGQLWRNPLYNWDVQKKENYKWWKTRFENVYKLTDVIRLDHFRALDKYFAIPYGAKTAQKGRWEKGPSSDFFETLFEKTNLPIIAEDLGMITKSVFRLRDEFLLPGMFVSQFHLLNYRSLESLNKKETKNKICYTGTHDNQTLKSYINELPKLKKVKLASFDKINPSDLNTYDVIKILAKTKFRTLIISMQDLLDLDDSARMNVPGTMVGNWEWRFNKEDLTDDVKENIRKILVETNRTNNSDRKVKTNFDNKNDSNKKISKENIFSNFRLIINKK